MPIVKIDWLEGRNEDQKRKIAQEITQTLVKTVGSRPESVLVVFTDHPRSDIAKGGILLSDT